MPKGSADGYLSAIADACDGYEINVYNRAFLKLRDTRKYRTLPMPAEAREACQAIDEVEKAKASKPDTRKYPDGVNGDWSKEAAFEFIRRAPIAMEAAREGWIGPLVGHVRQFHREPAWNEIGGLKKIQREFEDTLMIATGQWKPLGEAMARQQAAWASDIIKPKKENA